MKRSLILVLIAVLAACMGGMVRDPRCTPGGEICIKIEVDEPIRWGEPVTVKITVTSSKDLPRVGVSIYTFPPATVEGPSGWEATSREGMVWKGGAGWLTDVRIGQPMVFTRTVRLPLLEEGSSRFELQANVSTPQGPRGSDSVTIYFTDEGAKVYYSGTPLPIITRLIDQTVITTPLPSFTPLPTRTPFPTPSPTPTHPRPSPPPTPTPAAYPSPITPIALPTIAPWGYP